MWLTFKSVNLEESSFPSIMWMGLSNQLEALREKTEARKGEEILPPDGLQTQDHSINCSLSLQSANLQISVTALQPPLSNEPIS